MSIQQGQMLEVLFKLIRYKILDLILDEKTPWQTLDVLYETPRVQRLWVQHGDYRINLHRIFPCDTALIHPHPWPSAVALLTGSYEMGVGHINSQSSLATIQLSAGSSYEMIDPEGWHYVKPKEICLSIMLTGKPWPTNKTISQPGKGLNGPLSQVDKNDIIEKFLDHYNC